MADVGPVTFFCLVLIVVVFAFPNRANIVVELFAFVIDVMILLVVEIAIVMSVGTLYAFLMRTKCEPLFAALTAAASAHATFAACMYLVVAVVVLPAVAALFCGVCYCRVASVSFPVFPIVVEFSAAFVFGLLFA